MAGELAKAVCEVMKRVRYVEETGHNKEQDYDYASGEDLLVPLHDAMAENGLCLLPVGCKVAVSEHGVAKSGRVQWRSDVVMTYALMHVSGENVPLEMAGCGVDGQDKGVYKALTGALKYLLRAAFLLPTGDDPERVHQSEERADEQREQSEGQTDQVDEPTAPQGEPSQPAIDLLVADNWPVETVVPEVRDFCRWCGIEADPWSAAPERQLKLAEWMREQQERLDAWIAWWDEVDALLKKKKIGRGDLALWCEANDRPAPERMDEETRGKLLTYLRDADGLAQVHKHTTAARKATREAA